MTEKNDNKEDLYFNFLYNISKYLSFSIFSSNNILFVRNYECDDFVEKDIM